MYRLFRFLNIARALDRRVLVALGLLALAALLVLGAEALELDTRFAVLAIGLLAGALLAAWALHRWRARRAARRLEADLHRDAAEATQRTRGRERTQAEALRQRLDEAIRTIKTSKLGQSTGSAALYELPWYMIIGNPAAGKSTAVVQSGLSFPFSRGQDNILRGIGGTRHCDWFFTNEGILLDTAGRYATQDDDRAEWLAFLGMLKKHRPKAPINGILIAASLAELIEAPPDATIQLAKSLRQRVQDLTEALGVFAPVYLLFTKADLIPGFADFFEDRDPQERERVWGATLPYRPDAPADPVPMFDRHVVELQDGLRQLALAHMTLHRGEAMSPAVLAFPLEFAAMRPVLRSFIATLFEDNPFQHRPVFRGFYFTSAVQRSESNRRERNGVAEQFALTPRTDRPTGLAVGEHGFFLKDLFSKVIFADRHLVRQHANRARVRLRAWTFAAGVLVLATLLSGWTWSYVGNRQLVASVQADLDKAVRLQADRVDLASRLEALELLQDRVEQLAAWRHDHPWSLAWGLYQGDALERKLRQEYFGGVRYVMLEPVAQAIEGYLGEVNRHAADLEPAPRSSPAATPPAAPASAPRPAPPAPTSRYVDASETDVDDAYKALKTYLMLAKPQRMEAGHLADQITRFWRGWLEDNRGSLPREQLMRSAERMISFSLANLHDPAFPVLASNFGLVDQTRDNLRRVVHGTPAIERVYAEVKIRASTRYKPVTVAAIVGERDKALVAGSQVVSGEFTRAAWEGYVDKAFRDVAGNELQARDWVLKTSTSDDLSLQGSPEQVRKALTDLYKAEYVHQWQRFMQGISVTDFGTFDSAVERMNRLGDPEGSPIRKLMVELYLQTSWDNPSAAGVPTVAARRGLFDRFRQLFHRGPPAPDDARDVATANAIANVNANAGPTASGPVGRQFVALSRIMSARDASPSLLDGYLQDLGRLRARFNTMKNQGDAGPPARQLMAATLDGKNSELSDALRHVDEQILNGADDTTRSALGPLLVRPLIQSFRVLVQPTETEVNRLWAAQVEDLFQQSLAGKYPFDPTAKVEAAAPEIARVFGPEGAVARFASEALGPLVTRRGDTIAPRLWADVGLRLRPEFIAGFPAWVGPLDGAAGNAGGGLATGTSVSAAAASSSFQLLPLPAPGFTEYTVTIDGQSMTYRSGAAAWSRFVWPNPGAVPGASISGVTLDGRTVEVFAAPGAYGFERMIDAARVRKGADGLRELSWGGGAQAITLQYRAITSPGPAVARAGGTGAASRASGLRGLSLPRLVAGAEPGTARSTPVGSAPEGR